MINYSINWSLLDRVAIYNKLYALLPDVNGTLPIAKFHAIVSRYVKGILPIKVTKNTCSKHLAGCVYIGGLYYSDYDKKKRKSIEIIFSYHPDTKKIDMTPLRWRRACKIFADTVLHELIHMRQYRSRNFKTIPGYNSIAESAKQRKTQEYYGDTDEMGAFSFNIACELTDKFGGDMNAVIEFLDSDSYKRYKRGTFYSYMKTFDHNHNHPVIKLMKKKIVRNLPLAITGKPFKNNNYLTY